MADAAADPVEALLTSFDALTVAQRREAAAALRQALMLPAALYADRDALIVECRRQFFANRTDRDAAHAIFTEWRRYAETAWRRDRSSELCPARIVGTSRGIIWAIMRVSPRVLSAERIRKIVGHFK